MYACLLLKGPCCVLWTLKVLRAIEVAVVQFAQAKLVAIDNYNTTIRYTLHTPYGGLTVEPLNTLWDQPFCVAIERLSLFGALTCISNYYRTVRHTERHLC